MHPFLYQLLCDSSGFNAAIAATAHPQVGDLEKLGCHHDRKSSNYHCHRGKLAGKVFASQAEAQAALGENQQPQSPPPAAAPTPTSPSAPEGGMPFDRDLYGGWIDADGDCQDTRQEVLIQESLVPATLDPSGCDVVAGRWLDPYTGRFFTNPHQLDIDHFIPLAEVHRSGGASWTPDQRIQYANDLSDPRTLIAVSASANRSKGGRDPADWLPPNQAFRCDYARLWVAIKEHWGLRMDRREAEAVRAVLAGCG